MSSTSQPEWIAVDWGTSRLRAWGVGTDGSVLWQAASEDGMGSLTPDRFPSALSHLISAKTTGWKGPVVACGMVGSRQGWVEAPYRQVPCKPLGTALTSPPDHPWVGIVAGLSQADPADVMRGEETQVAGFLSLNPEFDGVLCLPGTHTKWAHISAGEIVSFQTFMTGELFSLLSRQSVLRHSLDLSNAPDTASFAEAVSDALSRPEKIAARLFSLRAEALLQGLDAGLAATRLSGLLIGLELAAARPYWLGREVAVLGADSLSARYIAALASQGLPATQADAEAMTLKGLAVARRLHLQTTGDPV